MEDGLTMSSEMTTLPDGRHVIYYTFAPEPRPRADQADQREGNATAQSTHDATSRQGARDDV